MLAGEGRLPKFTGSADSRLRLAFKGLSIQMWRLAKLTVDLTVIGRSAPTPVECLARSSTAEKFPLQLRHRRLAWHTDRLI